MTSTVDPFEFTEEGVHAAMAACGSTSAEVADTFRSLGLTGPRRSCHICPGAQFLWLMFPDASEIEVAEGGGDEVRIGRIVQERDDDGYVVESRDERLSVQMPDPWDDFVYDYDDARLSLYSFLEA